MNNNTDNFGFIISRHVNSENTNKYWNHCVKLLRTLYPLKKIIIIDDNSNYEFVKQDFDYKNIKIVKSEFPKRGELLPYYYFLKYKYFKNAIIIHDSVFFHRRIDFENFKNINVIPLWHFNSDFENIENTKRIVKNLKNTSTILSNFEKELNVLKFKNYKWYGCFGVQCYINLNFLEHLEKKYNLTKLILAVNSRKDRCCLERIFGLIFCLESPNVINIKSLFGNIMTYQKWGYTFNEYINDLKNKNIPKQIIKVWTGR